jgi:hypothetical protein
LAISVKKNNSFASLCLSVTLFATPRSSINRRLSKKQTATELTPPHHATLQQRCLSAIQTGDHAILIFYITAGNLNQQFLQKSKHSSINTRWRLQGYISKADFNRRAHINYQH